MLILDNDSHAVLLDSIHTPTPSEYFWVLDFEMMDFTLAPLPGLEEMIVPVLEVMVNGFHFVLPANWNMLVVDDDTYQLDVSLVEDLAGREFNALIYGPNLNNGELAVVTATDYSPAFKIVGPALNKHQMLCHPISPERWICVAPSDSYNKYLKNCVMGEII